MNPDAPDVPSSGRDWLAALLLRQHNSFLSRLTVGLARWRAVPRDYRRRFRRKVALSAAGAALVLALAAGPLLTPIAHAATIDVDNGVVTIADDGFCSLREAIDNAITDSQVFTSTGECDAGSGDDVINLPVDGDFVLQDGYYGTPFGNFSLLVGLTNLTIEGNGSTIRRDTNDTDEFGVLATYASDLTLNDVTISGGSGAYGGGLFSYDATLSVVDSTLSDNYAALFAGGLFSYNSDVLISGSTISDNRSDLYAGGLMTYGGTLNIVNSTISGNSAGIIGGLSVGFFDDDGTTATVTNSTITRNTGEEGVGGIAIFPESELTLSRSIVSGNKVGADALLYGVEIYNAIPGGVVNLDDYNVLGHRGLTYAEAFSNVTPGTSDVIATSDAAAIPLSHILRTTLEDNGGPTLTHNLVVGSPALDMAPDADCVAAPTSAVDQRGETRPFDFIGEGNEVTDTCDAGSVEATAPDTPPLTAVFMSAKTAGTTGDGLDFGPEDIIWWDGTEWLTFFDGSAAGLQPNNAKHNINAFSIPDPEEGDFIFSFGQNRRSVPGLSTLVDGMDLVYWNALTEEFSLFLDGQDVGLTNKTQEKIDGLHVLPGSDSPINGGACEAYILISTQGPGKVPNFGGGIIRFSGEDVLGFCATGLGEDTDGLWHLVLDGSEAGMPRNSTDSISFSDDGQTMYLTTRDTFDVDDATGGHSMVYRYDFGSEEFSGPFFSAPGNGLDEKVDGLHVEGELP